MGEPAPYLNVQAFSIGRAEPNPIDDQALGGTAHLDRSGQRKIICLRLLQVFFNPGLRGSFKGGLQRHLFEIRNSQNLPLHTEVSLFARTAANVKGLHIETAAVIADPGLHLHRA